MGALLDTHSCGDSFLGTQDGEKMRDSFHVDAPGLNPRALFCLRECWFLFYYGKIHIC